MSRAASKVTTEIDFEADGKQHGYFNVPHSRNDSAWGGVRVPMTVIKNGDGPTLLFTGGNHGDEYEGPIALMKLARWLEPGAMRGRVIILPALNYPAVKAGTRVSPIDDINMNRAFPGKRDGTVTQMIAHYVESQLLPLADAVVDIHSGGKTLMFSPFACIHALDDAGQMARARAALAAFDAPIGLMLVELDAEGMLDTSVEAAGKVFVGTELGGGGSAIAEYVAIAETGVRNLLCHFGVIGGEVSTRESRGLAPSRTMDSAEPGCYVLADDAGIYEPLVDLGAEVAAGDAIGQIHVVEQPEHPPAVYHAGRAGTLIGRHHPGLIQPGDFLALVAYDV